MATYTSRDVIDAIKLLVSPVVQQKSASNNTDLSMLFQSNLIKLNNQSSKDYATIGLPMINEAKTSIDWCNIFLDTCLHLLLCLKKSLLASEAKETVTTEGNFKERRPYDYAPPLASSVLSVSDQKIVASLTQFIICLGISPNVDSGVGIPLSMRSEFSSLLQEKNSLTDVAKNQNLVRVVGVLLDSIQVTSLGGVILSKFLNDILAALLQLSFKPRLQKTACSSEVVANLDGKESDEQKKDNVEKSVFHPSNAESNQIESAKLSYHHMLEVQQKDDRRVWKTELEKLLNKVYQPMVIRELLLLQGGPSKSVRATVKNPLPPAPVWLQKACGRLLSERLMKPNGVHNVLCGILDSTGGDEAGNWKQCEMIAKLLLNCPKQIQMNSYFQSICPQVLELIQYKDVLVTKKFLRIACCFINNIITRQHELGLELIIRPLQRPLLKCIAADDIISSTPGNTFIDEDSISACIDCLHKVFVIGGSEPSTELVQTLQPIIHPLFKLCIFSNNGICHLRSPVEDILQQFFKLNDAGMSVRVLKHLTLLSYDLEVMSPHLIFSPGPGGGAVVKVAEDKRLPETAPVDILGDQDVAATVLLEILGKSKINKLMGDFFVALLGELTNIMTREPEESSKKIDGETAVLLQLEVNQSNDLLNIQKALVVLNLVAKICDELGPDVLENKVQMIGFIEATLQRACSSTIEEVQASDSTLFQDETLSMALGLLSLIVADIKQVDIEMKKMLTSLISLLTIIGNKHSNKHLREMATSIRNSIATYGALKVDESFGDVSQTMKSLAHEKGVVVADGGTPKPVQLQGATVDSDGSSCTDAYGTINEDTLNGVTQRKSVVKERKDNMMSHSCEGVTVKDDDDDDDDTDVCSTKNEDRLKSVLKEKKDITKPHSCKKCSDEKECYHVEDNNAVNLKEPDEDIISESFDEAFKDLFDPLLPVRGHALIALGKLIRAKDPKALQKKDTLYRVFKEKLADDDTYIYLAAIQGLESMADVYPGEVIPALCSEYTNKTRHTVNNIEVRMKLGELLVKATRNLGELVPYYKQNLLGSILTVAKDPDPDVRASSLANLGEVCKLLKFSLGSVIHEVMNCLLSILQTDSEVIVRRACVNVVTLMLRGLGKEATKTLESNLLNLYRTLKMILRTETDDVMKLHAELALNEMDLFMKDYLFPKQTLSKKIVVLP